LIVVDFLSISLYQWIGFVFGVLYISFAAYNKNQCWIFSIVSTLAIACEDFFHLRLYFDGFIQIFYTLIAIIGLVTWKAGGKDDVELRLSTLGINKRIAYFLLVVLLSVPMGYLMQVNTEAAWPYLDGFTSVLAVFATFLMVYKFVDNWAYWIIIDVICVYLYFTQGAPLLAFLYFIYLILAVVAWRKWRMIMNTQ
jgi:nicotinamide mononucleotide transporter